MPPESLPRYVEIARAIEASVSAKPPGDARLPSSREIAREHGVSPVTASRAIQVLRDKGLIRTIDRSGSYATPRAQAAAADCWALVLRNTPGPWWHASHSFALSAFESAAHAEGSRFDPDCFDLDGPAARESHFRRQAREAVASGIRGVFLMPSRASDKEAARDEALLHACLESGLPVVLIERNVRGAGRRLEHDLAAADDFDGGLRCTEHLLEIGRRRIAFMAGSPTSSHEGRLAGYLAALGRAQIALRPLILEQQSDPDPRDACRRLADQVLRQKADAVVCYQDYAALSLIVELLARGVRVPADVAITGFDNLPIGEAFAIGLTTYAFPMEAIASQAIRVMRWRLTSPSGPPVKVLVQGELLVRQSTVPA
ncbi:HTH-type transcriptional regulator DegA [Aquisphaera giovannonii]|uniref:HTH-type transcriptional regulator DegA n=1 Tax=Aquisphaera giovannonii TaxID=406548 RepID=A0A5B9W964_9BACT|nr:GntR family transcriptional regulator [Aquisphaera giovannonii]QEH37158.1 HTH-type transcriptional regulator DegA [Aquisphaera giovannonii]